MVFQFPLYFSFHSLKSVSLSKRMTVYLLTWPVSIRVISICQCFVVSSLLSSRLWSSECSPNIDLLFLSFSDLGAFSF